MATLKNNGTELARIVVPRETYVIRFSLRSNGRIPLEDQRINVATGRWLRQESRPREELVAYAPSAQAAYDRWCVHRERRAAADWDHRNRWLALSAGVRST